jgi:hypothetical protein
MDVCMTAGTSPAVLLYLRSSCAGLTRASTQKTLKMMDCRVKPGNDSQERSTPILGHEQEKCEAVFRKDHAQTKS